MSSTSNISDFAQYLIQEHAKSIPVTPYTLHLSLRIWLKNFTQQALIHGIKIPTFSIKIAASWSLFTETLIGRFGVPEEEDNRRYTKLTLNSLVASLNLTNVSEVTTQAINLVVRTKFLDEPETVQHSSNDHHSTPLDIDYVSNYKNNPDYNRLSQQQQQ
ncbi:hypothetical protein G6F57_003365 [Rhizopus arrhizus]|uniref:Uncharacterized protein n=1 Tax=Rhizopus oryzae TaxID=64495 RepID=A0A9P7BNS0_RHIOR|nr:hypothetical protein G6F23_007293 [Rhizopus arrhizus]KAG1413397.1 hypothetical protein G6F58_007518 [Rhizopus delemar]KAG0757949.1 hypothetical protein G6F24_010137 [Rhizopus arrhizus]KAG0784077.1 hypothetical protein G6F21_010139 [Rhizopus arrhizus]KAG0798726.1 hypothetical protein G6F22_003938 [Rhizopus arrhizus]